MLVKEILTTILISSSNYSFAIPESPILEKLESNWNERELVQIFRSINGMESGHEVFSDIISNWGKRNENYDVSVNTLIISMSSRRISHDEKMLTRFWNSCFKKIESKPEVLSQVFWWYRYRSESLQRLYGPFSKEESFINRYKLSVFNSKPRGTWSKCYHLLLAASICDKKEFVPRSLQGVDTKWELAKKYFDGNGKYLVFEVQSGSFKIDRHAKKTNTQVESHRQRFTAPDSKLPPFEAMEKVGSALRTE